MVDIEHDCRGNVEDITNAVVRRWLRGKGRQPTSWAPLATVLEECGLTELADVIRFVKSAPGSKFLYST